MKTTNVRYAGWAAAVVSLLATTAVARGQQTNVTGQAYARGVQAYFSGQSASADSELLAATADDVNDPRPHYFRALSLLRQGRGDEARAEMELGASLEARSPGRYPIGKSLERVQGSDRLTLEKYRRQGRAQSAGLVDSGREKMHAEQNAARDGRGLRSKVSVPLDQLTGSATLDDWTSSSNRPVSNQTGPPVANSRSVETLSDPFIDDPQQPASPASTPPQDADPFATGDTTPVADSAAEAGAKVSSGKLFGILGRVLSRSAQANMPRLDKLSEQIPLPAGAPGSGQPASDDDPFAAPSPAATAPGPPLNAPMNMPMNAEPEFGAPPAGDDPFAESPINPN